MTKITIQDLQKQGARKTFPRFKAGQTVKIYEKIREGEKERTQIFEGLIIQKGGCGSSKTITARKIIGGIGVEKAFTLQSSSVEKIEIIKEAKVRRGKLFFMRERRGKSARLKEKFLTEKDLKEMTPHEVTEDELEEALEAQKEIDESTESSSQDQDEAKEEVDNNSKV